MTDPWSDPASPGGPYAGPPRTAPPLHGQPGPYPGYPPYGGYPSPYGQPGAYGHPGAYGYPGGYGYPGPWGPVPTGPPRPGQVVAASVLAFVQSGLVLLASVYVFFFASIARVAVLDSTGSSSGSGTVDDLATEGNVLALIQVLSVVALVVGGVLALGRRRGAVAVLLGGLTAQLVLAIYWAVRLNSLADDFSRPDPAAALTWFSLVFAAMPVVALGLLLFGPAREWLQRQAGGAPTARV